MVYRLVFTYRKQNHTQKHWYLQGSSNHKLTDKISEASLYSEDSIYTITNLEQHLITKFKKIRYVGFRAELVTKEVDRGDIIEL